MGKPLTILLFSILISFNSYAELDIYNDERVKIIVATENQEHILNSISQLNKNDYECRVKINNDEIVNLSCNNVEEIDGNVTIEIDGNVTTYYENGSKKFEKYYKKNRPIGTWIRWHKNGVVDTLVNFISITFNGSRVEIIKNVTKWHSNGQKSYEGSADIIKHDSEAFLQGYFQIAKYNEDGSLAKNSNKYTVTLSDSLTGEIHCFPWRESGLMNCYDNYYEY